MKFDNAPVSCLVCNGRSEAYDVVDFNKCGVEPQGIFLPLSGKPIYYFMCRDCGFCFAPEICSWSIQEFSENIYNDDYEKVDPEYKSVRPLGNAMQLAKLFESSASRIRHLDYGGGNGLLSKTLQNQGWTSSSYDPFVDGPTPPDSLGKFELITAFEVFEHVPDPTALVARLQSLLSDDGLVMFSTLLSDREIAVAPRQRLTWWYACPRNGHISLYSSKSLALLWRQQGFKFGSINAGTHLAFKEMPGWCSGIFGARAAPPV